MDDKCLLNQFGQEIRAIVQRDNGSCSINRLLQLIGPEHKKYEFWEALRYRLNEGMYARRNPDTNVLMLTFDRAGIGKDWYEYNEIRHSTQRFKFFIPPIPLPLLRIALRKPREALDNTLPAGVRRVKSAYPELNLWDDEWVRGNIVAPALWSVRERPIRE